MNRNVTAVYRTYSVADLVRRELESLDISRSNIHVIPDTEQPIGASGYRDDRSWADKFHDLYLPEDDVRTYQQSVRRGDYVVSANVDDDYVDRVTQIMRRPEAEAYNLDTRGNEFRNESVFPHSDATRAAPNSRLMGRRDTANTDPYVRSYRRDEPYVI